jgi:hypothetical protein
MMVGNGLGRIRAASAGCAAWGRADGVGEKISHRPWRPYEDGEAGTGRATGSCPPLRTTGRRRSDRALRRGTPPVELYHDEAGLLTRGSTHRPQPSQRTKPPVALKGPPLAAHSCGGSAGLRPEERHRLPVLAPSPSLERGTSTHRLDTHAARLSIAI